MSPLFAVVACATPADLAPAPSLELTAAERTAVEALAEQLAAREVRSLALSFDRERYAPGDDLWVRLHEVDPRTGRPAWSSTLELALIDASDGRVRVIRTYATGEDAHGLLELPLDLPPGRHTVRARASGREVHRTVLVGDEPPTGPASAVAVHPEGGSYVASLPARLHLETTDARGNPAPGRVALVDDSGRAVAVADTDAAGLGRIDHVPEPGRRYQARLAQAVAPLPTPSADGCVLVDLDDDLARPPTFGVRCSTPRRVTLVLVQGERVARAVVIEAGPERMGVVEHRPEPGAWEGVLRATLLADGSRPLAERLVWVGDEQPPPRISVAPLAPRPGEAATLSIASTGPIDVAVAVTPADSRLPPTPPRREDVATALAIGRWVSRMPPATASFAAWLPVGAARPIAPDDAAVVLTPGAAAPPVVPGEGGLGGAVGGDSIFIGPIPQARWEEVIGRARPFQRCLEAAQARNPAAGGDLVLKVHLEPDGSVIRVERRITSVGGAIEGCVIDQLRTLRFGPLDGPATVVARWSHAPTTPPPPPVSSRPAGWSPRVRAGGDTATVRVGWPDRTGPVRVRVEGLVPGPSAVAVPVGATPGARVTVAPLPRVLHTSDRLLLLVAVESGSARDLRATLVAGPGLAVEDGAAAQRATADLTTPAGFLFPLATGDLPARASLRLELDGDGVHEVHDLALDVIDPPSPATAPDPPLELAWVVAEPLRAGASWSAVAEVQVSNVSGRRIERPVLTFAIPTGGPVAIERDRLSRVNGVAAVGADADGVAVALAPLDPGEGRFLAVDLMAALAGRFTVGPVCAAPATALAERSCATGVVTVLAE